MPLPQKDTLHEKYMKRALALARRAQGRTSPNPLVGAVIVRDGQIVGEGYHRRAGEAHAEVIALQQAGERARGATLYVTLEPCAHQGRTPPCTKALIRAGVAQVYYALTDPDPRVCGRGAQALAEAGIAVQRGLCQEEALEINLPFFKRVTTGLPWVTAKFAMSLDGKIATRTGEARWISSAASRRRVHQLRNVSDAILVGAGTVLADDPQLTTRLERATQGEPIHHPLRIVADSRGRVPLSARLFQADLPGRTVLATTCAAPAQHLQALQARGVEVWRLPADARGRVSMPALLQAIADRDLLTLLVEGGAELLASLFSQRLIDQVWVFLAPLIIGGRGAPGPVGGEGVEHLSKALRLETFQVERSGRDLWIRARVATSFRRDACSPESSKKLASLRA
jgi:diaminohydroxyphosphoribosylaminopyrimidine deaminase/5-amino-6-(5-phosphoribosylamino)uracil reductase